MNVKGVCSTKYVTSVETPASVKLPFLLGETQVCKSKLVGSLPVFINKVLLEHSHTHLFTYCG